MSRYSPGTEGLRGQSKQRNSIYESMEGTKGPVVSGTVISLSQFAQDFQLLTLKAPYPGKPLSPRQTAMGSLTSHSPGQTGMATLWGVISKVYGAKWLEIILEKLIETNWAFYKY